MKKIRLTLLSLFFACCAVAQDSTIQTNQSATGLRADGKIYVVVAVLLAILTGLFIYVIRLDRKISKLEKDK